MAKIFDLHSFRKDRSGETTSKSQPRSLDVERTRDNVRPIDFGKGFSGDQWPGASLRMPVNAWAGLLLAVGVLCGIWIGRSDKKPTVASAKPDAQVQATPPTSGQSGPASGSASGQGSGQATGQAQAPPKPSPIVPAARVQAESGTAPMQTPGIVPNAITPPAPHYIPVKYEATHKKMFGGCTGELELTGSGLRFNCPHGNGLNLPVGSIAKAHKDGIELKSGEKYHFTIENRTKEQVEAIFLSWVNTVQPLPQTNRAAF